MEPREVGSCPEIHNLVLGLESDVSTPNSILFLLCWFQAAAMTQSWAQMGQVPIPGAKAPEM